MRFSPRLSNLILCGLLCRVSHGVAAIPGDDDANAERHSTPPTIRAYPVEAPPTLDGEVLNDPAWQAAEPATGFWQTTPREGEPASQKTEVRLLYSPKILYVGVMCYDRNPSEIVVSDSRRDADLDETDCFQMILDTFDDNQNGFLFGTNPAGIEYDAQVTNEGGGSRFSRSGGGFNLNWDASWEVETQITELGWSAEFAIPFRTLRFEGAKSQAWGVNFQRNIRRNNETAFWAKLPRQFNLQKISMAGSLQGLAGIRQNNLKVTPFSLGQVVRQRNLQGSQGIDWEGSAGFDAKYSITSGLTLDASYNTDFAQVEVDDQQINLDRFGLFFPEKRPFFLENAGHFSVGSPREVELFFSRRIGLDADGREAPIIAGGRLSGKAGGFNIGLLSMQTEASRFVERNEVDPSKPDTIEVQENNFSVARLSKDLPNRSGIGALFTNRQGFGKFSTGNDYGRTLAIDARWGIGTFGLISGYAARTFSGDKSVGADNALNLRANYNSEAWLLNAAFRQVGSDFEPELGFLRRDGYRRLQASIFNRTRPKDRWGLLELRPHTSYTAFWDFDGFQESGFWHIDNHFEWKNGYELHTGVNLTREGIKPDSLDAHNGAFEISDGVFVPAGTYDHAEANIVFLTNPGARWFFRVRALFGGFWGGDRVAWFPALRLRTSEAFNVQFNWSHQEVDLPGGSFTTNLLRARLSYSFTPRIFLQGLLQYNDRDDVWGANVRFGWLDTANTGLFVVYREVREEVNGRFEPDSRSVTVKYSRLFDLLN